MKLSRVLLASFAVALAGSTAARADNFTFSFGTSSSQFTGTGTLTGYLSAPDTYTVTGITGTSDTGNGTDRVITGLSSFDDSDNLLLETSPGVYSFDSFGLSYELKNGALINISSSTIGTDLTIDTETLERTSTNIASENDPYTITATTPEPGSFVLLGTGLLGIVGVARRRFAL